MEIAVHPKVMKPLVPGAPMVSVLLAAHNEAKNIPIVSEKLARTFAKHHINGEAIIINDGSTDQTAQVLDQASAQYAFIKAIHHRKNLGLSEVLNTGMRHAQGEIILLMPADLESDPEEDIPKLLNEMQKGFDAVAGWRQNRKDGKVFASSIYNYVCRKLFNLHIHDMNWIKAVRTDALASVHLRSDWYRFLMPVLAARGYKISEVQTTWYPRKAGKTKFGFYRFLISFFDVLAVKFILTFTRKPMFFFGLIGSLLVLAGVLIGAGLVYLFFTQAMQIRPLLLFAFVCILAGLTLVMMGFLAELIVEGQQRLERLEEKLAHTVAKKE